MDTLRIVQFDIHGVNPANKIVGEEIKIRDKTCPWIIPDGSPFFGDYPANGKLPLTVVYDERGTELVRDRDYWLEEEFIPLVEVTGRPIVCFVRLSEAILAGNTKVTVNYQSVGAYFIPRNSIEDWVKEMQTGIIPVPFEKVFGVPLTLPPEWHSHGIKTEIGDWFELTWFFAYLAQIVSTRDPEVADDLDNAIKAAFDLLYSTRDTQQAILKAHDRNYTVPHGPTKASVLLGNHDNYRTATVPEQKVGTAANLLSTPQGVQEVLKVSTPSTSAAMLSGILPISQFGNDSFLPPNISGSFEGIGQQTECSGICLEPGGTMMVLSNHMDGRTQGLYFSTVDGYNTDKPVVTYTNFKYTPPVLETQGIEVNRIVAGSGNKVIMVGVNGTNDWFIALTNNTFDPAAHNLVRCDMSALWPTYGNPYGNGAVYGNNDRAIIHHMEKWLVLVQSNGNIGMSTQRFFRVLTEDVRLGKPVKWEPLPLTYTDWDGTQFTNILDFRAMNSRAETNGEIFHVGRITTLRPVDLLVAERRAFNISWPITGSGGLFHYHTINYYNLYYRKPDNPNAAGSICTQQYTFNPETGVFALVFKQPPVTLKLDGTDGVIGFQNVQYLGWMLTAYQQPATVLLSTGEFVTGCIFQGSLEFPVQISVMKFNGYTSAESLLAANLTRPAGTFIQSLIKPIINTPTKNGAYAGSLTYEADGEIFSAYDQMDYARKVYCRQVTGDYLIRPTVRNLNLGDIYTRPLTTQIYETDMLTSDTTMSITGTAAELVAGGVEHGSGSLSSCGWSSTTSGYPRHSPQNPRLRAPASGNVLISFPRTYSRALDAGTKKASYKGETFYGIRQAMVDRLKGYVNVAANSPNWAFTWAHLGAEAGQMFKGLNHSIIQINWHEPATGTARMQVLLVRPIVEAPNADHPGVYLITDFQILHNPGVFKAYQGQLNVGPHFYDYGSWVLRPMLTGYRNGNILKIIWAGSYAVAPVLSITHAMSLLLDLNLSTNQLSNVAPSPIREDLGEPALFIPKLGMSDLSIVINGNEGSSFGNGASPYANTGGAAAIYVKPGVGNFMTCSVYPETGWIIFFQENIKMMINGTTYSMEGGTVDLRDISADPRNKTFYIYATIEGSKPKYLLSDVKLRRSASVLHVSTVKTNDQQILTLDRNKVFVIGDHLLSYTRDGGTIPVSAGFPQDEGNFTFLRAAELLP